MSLTIRTVAGATLALFLLSSATACLAADAKAPFASETIDLGIVVKDVNKSVKFYTDVLGFKELPGFTVPADFCADAGLTDHKALNIKVLALGESEKATKIKLMELPGVDSKKSESGFVHSQLGYRYITLHVADGAAAKERLKKAGIKPIAKGPVALPAGLPPGLALIVVRDPDGNFVELIVPNP